MTTRGYGDGNTKKSPQGRKWFGTINNYSPEEECKIKDYITTKEIWIMGKHVGAKSKIPHIHFWFQSKTPVCFSTLKKLVPRANLEKSNVKNIDKTYNYLNKDGIVEGNYAPLSKGTKARDLKTRIDCLVWHDRMVGIFNSTIESILQLKEYKIENKDLYGSLYHEKYDIIKDCECCRLKLKEYEML